MKFLKFSNFCDRGLQSAVGWYNKRGTSLAMPWVTRYLGWMYHPMADCGIPWDARSAGNMQHVIVARGPHSINNSHLDLDPSLSLAVNILHSFARGK